MADSSMPTWDEFKPMTIRWVSRNMWKVQVYFGSYEEALAEARMHFFRCVNLFNNKPPEPRYKNRKAQFNNYYRLALVTWWSKYAKADSALRGIQWDDPEQWLEVVSIDEAPEVLTVPADELSDAALIEELLLAGPEEVRQFVSDLIKSTPDDVVDAIFAGDGKMIRHRIMAMCGVDVIKMARGFFESRPAHVRLPAVAR
jgi:hypothetical protein